MIPFRVRLITFGAAVTLAAATGLSACGSSNSSGPTVTDTLSSVALKTGLAFQGGGLPAGVAPGVDPSLGDDDFNNPGQTARGFITFDLTPVPSGAHIRTATMTLAQCDIVGAPYPTFGNVVLDHVILPAPIDTTLYTEAALASGVAILSTDAAIGPKSADVTASVANDVSSSRSASQFRLRWSTMDGNNNGLNDNVAFQTDSAHSLTQCDSWVHGNQPRLVVEFQK